MQPETKVDEGAKVFQFEDSFASSAAHYHSFIDDQNSLNIECWHFKMALRTKRKRKKATKREKDN